MAECHQRWSGVGGKLVTSIQLSHHCDIQRHSIGEIMGGPATRIQLIHYCDCDSRYVEKETNFLLENKLLNMCVTVIVSPAVWCILSGVSMMVWALHGEDNLHFYIFRRRTINNKYKTYIWTIKECRLSKNWTNFVAWGVICSWVGETGANYTVSAETSVKINKNPPKTWEVLRLIIPLCSYGQFKW